VDATFFFFDADSGLHGLEDKSSRVVVRLSVFVFVDGAKAVGAAGSA
jgi:hypothetical protein